LSHAEFKWVNALPSILLVAFGVLFSLWMCLGVFGERRNPFKGLTQRSRIARGGHTFLDRKYYLDDLYEKVVVHAVAHPIAKAAYWFNQHVIDAIVDGFGRATTRVGRWIYRNIDQRVVDGAVNASGTAASETGHALQPIQSGKVNQYGALLFGAATVGAIVLILINV
jgi:NADH-quinone oxidoreductase subunit L